MTIRLETNNGVACVPTRYNSLVQAAIYSHLTPTLSKFLHEKGFMFEQRHFKLFCFSKLLGNNHVGGGLVRFVGPVYLAVSSPIKQFIKALASSLLKEGRLRIGDQTFKVTSIKFSDCPRISQSIKIQTLSPITMYSTLQSRNGVKKTYYYSPFEREFAALLEANLKKKHLLVTHRNSRSPFQIKPLRTSEIILVYKGTVIKGWGGTFVLTASRALLKTAYETGLGGKNSMGFGLFEVLECL